MSSDPITPKPESAEPAEPTAPGLEVSLLLEPDLPWPAAPLPSDTAAPAPEAGQAYALSPEIAGSLGVLSLLDVLVEVAVFPLDASEHEPLPPSRSGSEVVYDDHKGSAGAPAGLEVVGILFGTDPETPV